MVIPRAFLPGYVDLVESNRLPKTSGKRESGGGQRGLTMINVTDGASTDVGPFTFKF
jgi:hypothetical protein